MMKRELGFFVYPGGLVLDAGLLSIYLGVLFNDYYSFMEEDY